MLTLLCDGLSTVYVMLGIGPQEELHPVVRCVSVSFGPVVGPLFGVVGKAIAGLLVAIYCRRFAAYILVTASIISIWAAWYNMWGFKLYVANILKWFPL